MVAHWVENPYWLHFSGERYFQHRVPIEPSSMTRWRQRLGEAGAEQMLRATIETGIALGAIGPAQLKRNNVNTTVQNGMDPVRSRNALTIVGALEAPSPQCTRTRPRATLSSIAVRMALSHAIRMGRASRTGKCR